MQNYTTQMDAARKGIVTPEMEIVAKKEYRLSLIHILDLWMVAGLGLGVFGAALATLIAQGISAIFSFLIFLHRMRRYESPDVYKRQVYDRPGFRNRKPGRFFALTEG